MPSFFNLVSGHWYRFDRYVIEEGVIRPAPDAQGDGMTPGQIFARRGPATRALHT